MNQNTAGELVALALGVVGLGMSIMNLGFANFGGGINPYITFLPIIFYLLITTGIYLNTRRNRPIFAKRFKIASIIFFLTTTILCILIMAENLGYTL
jgi:hypothetical protein